MNRPRLTVWLESARLSNLPTVLSNALVGLALGYDAAGRENVVPPVAAGSRAELLGRLLSDRILLIVAVGVFYAAGMILNDVMDRRGDAIHRPDRPIPSGRLRTRHAAGAGGLLLIAGLGISLVFGWWALLLASLLVIAIVAYDGLHHRWPASIALMGVCRGLVYLLAASTLASPSFHFFRVTLPFALILTGYIVLLTVVARLESAPRLDRRRWLALAMIPVVLAPALSFGPTGWRWSAAAAAIALGLWLTWAAWLVTREPPRTGPAVQAWLAGICLVDAWFLMLLNLPLFALVAGTCFGATLLLHRRIPGT